MMLDLRHAALEYLAKGSRVAEMVIAMLDASPERLPAASGEPVAWVRVIDEALVCSHLDVADQGTANGALVITTSREAMNSEVDSLRQKSLGILNSVDYHKKIVQDCEVLLQRLNPEFAEQKQQKQEIDNLKAQMSEMMNGMKELMAQIKKETPKS